MSPSLAKSFGLLHCCTGYRHRTTRWILVIYAGWSSDVLLRLYTHFQLLSIQNFLANRHAPGQMDRFQKRLQNDVSVVYGVGMVGIPAAVQQGFGL